MAERKDYVHVPQRAVARGPAEVAHGSFGASTCVIAAGVNADGTHTVAHIDAETPDLMLQFQKGCKLTLMDTGQNGPLLAALLKGWPHGAVSVIEGSSLMVRDGVVTPGVGPPVRVDTASMDKLHKELSSAADAILAMAEGQDRPPPPGMDYYWSVIQRKWIPYVDAGGLSQPMMKRG